MEVCGYGCRSSRRAGEPATRPPRCSSATGSLLWSWRTRTLPSGTTLDTSPLVSPGGALTRLTSRHIWLTTLFAAVLFPRHTNANARDNTINLIHTFRDYLHYHIKCSKVRSPVWCGGMGLACGLTCPLSSGLHSHPHEGQNLRFPEGAEPGSTRRREEGDENHNVSWCGSAGTRRTERNGNVQSGDNRLRHF